MRIVDFRSDTVTLPTPEMRRAMVESELGDDVFGDDPTVNRLERITAEKMGKDAAMFVASGTMGNLVAALTHCQRGDEMIVGDKAHMFLNEAGGASALGGISYRTVRNDDRGMLDPEEVEAAIRGSNIHHPRTALITLENTHNVCGGTPLTPADTGAIADVARRNGIPLHIDGARVFNAAVCLETPVSELVKDADSISTCMSKGLSAPIGSLLCGSHEFIDGARRWRKMIGGGMRQVGVIAGPAIEAIESMTERLADDHANAHRLAVGLGKIPGISIDPDSLPTNLVFFEVTQGDPAELARRLTELGVMGGAPQRAWRYVTHYGIDADDIDHALGIIESTFRAHAY